LASGPSGLIRARDFFLNGEHVQINGVCDHHDLGALGTAVNMRALERQIQLLQEMGCNAIRTSHNPPAPELLELCDRLGMLVMDEASIAGESASARMIITYCSTTGPRRICAPWWRRDRNHPCVILWSIGNEVREQWEPDGWRFAAHLAGLVREEDRTRFIISGCNNVDSGYNGFPNGARRCGLQLQARGVPAVFARNTRRFPCWAAKPRRASVRAGDISSRFSNDKAEGRANFQVSSYDLYAPRWRLPPDVEFKGLDEAPFAAGEFVWTGFDYLGEPTPYNSDSTNLLNFSDPAEQAKMAQELKALGRITVPSRSSYFGILTWPGSRRTGSSSIRRAGGRTSRWPTSSRTGTGPSGSGRSLPCLSTPRETRPSCS